MENKKSGPWRPKIEEEMWKEATEAFNNYVPWRADGTKPTMLMRDELSDGQTFKIKLSSQWFNPGDLISPSPKPKWWQKLLSFVTFGLYKPKAPALYLAGYDPYRVGNEDIDCSIYIIKNINNGENKEGKV